MTAKRKPPRNPLSDADVAAFDKAIQKWKVSLNLSDWDVYKGVGEIRAKNIRAEIYGIEPEHRIARYRVSRDFANELVTGDTLERYARHEILHLFLHGLIRAVKKFGEDSDEVLAEEHRIIMVLGPLLDPWLDSQVEDEEDDQPDAVRH
jgi:hypothetical protein